MAKETISQTEGLCKEVANCIRNAYDRGYKQGFKDGNYDKEFFCNLNFEHGTNKGLDDAWELVRKLRHPSYEDTYSDDEKRDIFGYVSSDSILTNLSASEAIAKIKEYEEKKRRCDIVMIAKDMAQTMAEKLTNEQTAEDFVEWFRTNIGGDND